VLISPSTPALQAYPSAKPIHLPSLSICNVIFVQFVSDFSCLFFRERYRRPPSNLAGARACLSQTIQPVDPFLTR
jgi:hypothetical protein